MKCSQLLLLSDPALAEAAVKMQSEAYAVVTVAKTEGRTANLSALYASVHDFVLSVRRQLRLPPIPGIQRAAYEKVDRRPTGD